MWIQMTRRTKVNFDSNRKKISFLGKSPKEMKILKRQGMKVTPNELKNLANKLQTEFEDTLRNLDIKLSDSEINNKSFIVNIINKTKASDTWMFEK